jgi:hypothetical protein
MRPTFPAKVTQLSRRTTWARAVFVTCACALVLGLGACDGGDDEAGGDDGGTSDADVTTTTTAPPSTTTQATTTTLTPEDEVLAAYRAADAAVFAAFDPPNPNHPELLAHISGEALTRVQGLIRQFEGQGVSVVGTIQSQPELLSLVGDQAVIEDCFVDRSQVVDTATRAPVGEPGETTLHIESHLERIGGTWMVVHEQELSEACTPG